MHAGLVEVVAAGQDGHLLQPRAEELREPLRVGPVLVLLQDGRHAAQVGQPMAHIVATYECERPLQPVAVLPAARMALPLKANEALVRHEVHVQEFLIHQDARLVHLGHHLKDNRPRSESNDLQLTPRAPRAACA